MASAHASPADGSASGFLPDSLSTVPRGGPGGGSVGILAEDRTGSATVSTPGPPREVVDSLRRKIRRIETAGRRDGGRVISAGCAELDRMLPEGGLAAGSIVEWLTPPGGYGARILSLLAARSACARGGALVVIDPERSFFAPAARGWGIDLSGVVVLRPPCGDRRALYWAIDQSLRSPAVGAVWGALPEAGERWQRRFQLSVESSGATGLFIRPARVLGQPGWSEVQWLIERNAARAPEGFDREIQLRLVRVRGGVAGAAITVRIDFTTGKVRGGAAGSERGRARRQVKQRVRS